MGDVIVDTGDKNSSAARALNSGASALLRQSEASGGVQAHNGFDNQLSATASALHSAAPALLDEFTNDIKSGRAAATIAVSAPIGLGTKALLNNSPVAMKVAMGVAAVGAMGYELITSGAKVANFYSEAWNADTAEKRDELGRSAGRAIAKDVAGFTEASIGLGLGGLAGKAAVSYSPKLQELAYATTNRVEYATRTLVPEKLYFKAPGSKQLGEDVISADKVINLPKLASTLREPWQGVERSRAVDLQTRRASVSLPGTPDSAYMGFPDRANMITMHLHPPGHSGFPSRFDLFSSDALNVIHNDTGMVIYKGQRSEWLAALKQTEEAMKARSAAEGAALVPNREDVVKRALANMKIEREMVVVDNPSNSVTIQRSLWTRPTRLQLRESRTAQAGWRDAAPVHLDYDIAMRELSAFRQGSSADYSTFLKQIENAAAARKPGQ